SRARARPVLLDAPHEASPVRHRPAAAASRATHPDGDAPGPGRPLARRPEEGMIMMVSTGAYAGRGHLRTESRDATLRRGDANARTGLVALDGESRASLLFQLFALD
ncbi:hypothetical protein, partial [Streptomyces sp. NPDC054958]